MIGMEKMLLDTDGEDIEETEKYGDQRDQFLASLNKYIQWDWITRVELIRFDPWGPKTYYFFQCNIFDNRLNFILR